MDKLADIVDNTMNQLKKNNIVATPDNYFKEFIIQVENSNLEHREYELFNNIIERFSFTLGELLAPSLQYDIEDEIEKLSDNILSDKTLLFHKDTIERIKDITHKRIYNDRKVIRNKTEDMIKLSILMSRHFDETLSTSENTSTEIAKIKKELESLDISSSSHRELGLLQSKLINTIYNMEHSLEKSKIVIHEDKSYGKSLHEAVIKLQKELVYVKEERDLDYLTNILNRRAFDKESEKIEKKYNIFNADYAVVFYDIDHFKLINDKYGHECGDIVLKEFASLLKDLTRKEDVIGRYGGEEFVVLLNYDDEKEIIKYLKRVKELIFNNKFIYKSNEIIVKFSAGLSMRKNYNSFIETLNYSDKLLYQAKNSGRDKIIMDNKTEL